MKQTAVEWLVKQLKKQGFLDDLDVKAAKQIEKEQIINAFDTGHRIGAWNFLGDEYYEKTFKNETK